MENKKTKLSISSAAKKSIKNIEIAKTQGKNSVLIEKTKASTRGIASYPIWSIANTPTEKDFLETTTFFPIYLSDQIVRRSESLLRTSQSVIPSLLVHPKTLDLFSIQSGEMMTLKLINNPIFKIIELKCVADYSVAEGVVAIANGHPKTNNIFPSQQLVSINID